MMEPSQKQADDQRIATFRREWKENERLEKLAAESKAGKKKPTAESKGGKKTGDGARGKKAAQQ